MKTNSMPILVIATVCTALVCTVLSATEEKADNLPVVILLGDSIRMNYQATVAAELKDKVTVWSPEENCRHTAFVLEQLDKWVEGRNASVIHINVGLHDLFLNAKTDQPRHDLETYSANLRKIIARLKQLTDAEIIFALTTPVIEERQAASEGYKRVVRRDADVVVYNRKAAAIANEAGIHVNDIYSVAVEAGVDKILRESDGIHLSEYGEEVIGKHVAQTVMRRLRGCRNDPDESGFATIFNGKDFDGWDGKPGCWEVRDGEIWCTGDSKEKNWLIWRDEQPSDFILRLEFRWDKGNSGVQVRSDDLGKWMVHGYQVEVAQQSVMGLWHHSLLPADHPKKQSRHLMGTAGQSVVFTEDGSKTVQQNHDAETVKAKFKEHAWNTMEIVAKGDTLVQKINGVVFSTLVDRDKDMRRKSGYIALQDHGKGCEVAFRNIRLKVLTTP